MNRSIFGLINKLGAIIVQAVKGGFDSYAEPRSMQGQRIWCGVFPTAKLAWKAAK